MCSVRAETAFVAFQEWNCPLGARLPDILDFDQYIVPRIIPAISCAETNTNQWSCRQHEWRAYLLKAFITEKKTLFVWLRLLVCALCATTKHIKPQRAYWHSAVSAIKRVSFSHCWLLCLFGAQRPCRRQSICKAHYKREKEMWISHAHI